MTNSGEIDGVVIMGEGNNTFINTGILHAGVSFGTGDDLFKTTKSAGVTITMGDGNDTFIGGSGGDDVIDGKGNDSYSLGAGDDRIAYGYDGADTFDGGTGIDIFSASSISSGGLFINLDSKAHTYAAVTAAKNSLNAWPSGGQIGTIKGFETVSGTAVADIIHGSSLGERLDGAVGADIVIGGGGADTLTNNNDGAVDTFVYESIKDSGATKATRDALSGFEGVGTAGGDVIDLSAIDANTRTAGDQGFDFIGNNVAFHKIAGELRTVTEGADTIIQADVNGDGKADLTIDITGIKSFDAGDFNL
jgi:serralysin